MNATKPPDADLVARACNGDRAAFDALVDRYRPLVEWLARRLLNDREAAEDCVQTTFIRAWERLSQLREASRFASWLQTICRSVAANMRASESLRQDRETAVDYSSGAPDLLDRLLTRLWIRKAVAQLPELYRRPVSQFYFEGFSQQEIARHLRVPLGTVKARLHYARAKLRDTLSAMEEITMEKIEFTDLMEAFMGMEEPEPRLNYEELAHETLQHYSLGKLRKIGSVYRPSDSVGIAIETDRGRYRLWRYQPWMTRETVELEHHLLRHLQEKDMPVKRLIPGANGETTFFIDHHFVAVFEWFGGTDPEWEQLDTQEALGDLCGRWVGAVTDFDPPVEHWRELASTWRPRKGWALALPCYDLPQVPERMGLFQAVRALKNPLSYHEEFLRGVDDTEKRLQRFEKQVNTLGLKELPRCITNGVMMGVIQEFDLTIAHVDDYVYEPRIGNLGRLLDLAVYQSTFPDAPGHDRARQVLDAFQKHVSLTDAELRALPWIALSFGLFYRVFHVLMYMDEVEDNPEGEGARYFATHMQEELARLTRQEEDTEGLTEVFLNG